MTVAIGQWIGRFTDAPDDEGHPHAVTESAHLVETTREHDGAPGVVTRCGREMRVKTGRGVLGAAGVNLPRCLTCLGIHNGSASTVPLEEATE